MTAFECYTLYLALKRHFTTKAYDFFKYNGAVKCSEKSFFIRKDQKAFLKMSRQRDPKGYCIGNMIYNKSMWAGEFVDEYFTEFQKYRDNGTYWFKQDLSRLRSELSSNLDINDTNHIPYIIHQLNLGNINIFTACVFEMIFKCDKVWSSNSQYFVFKDTSQKVLKSYMFFDIDIDKYRAILIDFFEVV